MCIWSYGYKKPSVSILTCLLHVPCFCSAALQFLKSYVIHLTGRCGGVLPNYREPNVNGEKCHVLLAEWQQWMPIIVAGLISLLDMGWVREHRQFLFLSEFFNIHNLKWSCYVIWWVYSRVQSYCCPEILVPSHAVCETCLTVMILGSKFQPWSSAMLTSEKCN